MSSPAPRRALALLALPALVVAMDQNVLFLALPTLTAEVGASAVEQLWVSDIYGLMVAVFLIPFGALGDRIGRRRLLLAGSAGFAVFSLIAAFAPSVEVLIAARALLGIAGATIAPASLGLLVTLFPQPDERARAIGLWMACFMVGIALGPSLGGLLLDHFWWGAVFLPGMPLMLVVLLGGRRALPESEISADATVDVPSALWSRPSVRPGRDRAPRVTPPCRATAGRRQRRDEPVSRPLSGGGASRCGRPRRMRVSVTPGIRLVSQVGASNQFEVVP